MQSGQPSETDAPERTPLAPGRRRRWWRRLGFALLLLLLGFTTSVAIAWAGAGIASLVVGEMELASWKAPLRRSTGTLGLRVIGTSTTGDALATMEAWQPPPPILVASGGFGTFQPEPPSHMDVTSNYGWPWRVLSASVVDPSGEAPGDPYAPFDPDARSTPAPRIRPFSIEVGERAAVAAFRAPDLDHLASHQALPISPLWPAIAWSTLLWAGIWLLFLLTLSLPWAGRRVLRRVRGRCPACGYAKERASSLHCSECGWHPRAAGPWLPRWSAPLAVICEVLLIAGCAVWAVTLVQRYPRPSPLHVAALRGDAKRVDEILRAGAAVDAKYIDADTWSGWAAPPGATALEWAVATKRLEVAKRLLQAGANPALHPEYLGSPLAAAVRNRQPDMVRLLLDAGVMPKLEALIDAACISDGETLRSLVNRYGPLDEGSAEILLMRGAANPASVPVVAEALARRGLSREETIAIVDHSGALAGASEAGCVECLEKLIALGASVGSTSGSRAILRAIQRSHVTVVKRLVDAGAKLDSTDPPLVFAAVYAGSPKITRILITAGADPRLTNSLEPQVTALRAAVWRSSEELVRILWASGCDPTERDENGESLLFRIHWPEASDGFLRLMFSLGIDVNAPDGHGFTPLMHAVFYRDPRAIRTILDAGGDLERRDDHGRTALDYAETRLDWRRVAGPSIPGPPPDEGIAATLRQEAARLRDRSRTQAPRLRPNASRVLRNAGGRIELAAAATR